MINYRILIITLFSLIIWGLGCTPPHREPKIMDISAPSPSFDIASAFIDSLAVNYTPFHEDDIHWPRLRKQFGNTSWDSESRQDAEQRCFDLVSHLDDNRIAVITRRRLGARQRRGVRGLDPDIINRRPTLDDAWWSYYGFGPRVDPAGRTDRYRTPDGIVYLIVNSANCLPVKRILDMLTHAKGAVFDFRWTSPSSCRRGDHRMKLEEFTSAFHHDQPIWALSTRRDGMRWTDQDTLRLVPSQGDLDLPIACLVGPACIDDRVEMVMQLAALPRTTVIGTPTSGASSARHHIQIDDFLEVIYPVEQLQTPEGVAVTDAQGFTPDRLVKQKTPGDPELDAALAHVRKNIDLHDDIP